MPYLGLTSFLQVMVAFGIPPSGVSMPYLGLTSFLRTDERPFAAETECVNALSRAHIISTTIYIRFIYHNLCVSMPYLGLTSFLQDKRYVL